MKLYTIWDIDNCLADDSWRQYLIDWGKDGDERYRRYNEELERDLLYNGALFKLFLDMRATPVFFTGRSEYLRGKTMAWLHNNLCPLGMGIAPVVYMRPDNYPVSPKALKEEMLNRFFHDHMGFGNRIIGAFDDLEAVVKMYRDHNLPAAQVAIHRNFEQAYKPADLAL